jgi:hypothetical protein
MSFDQLRRRAAVVRELPLESVLIVCGAVRDRRDRSQWHTAQGPLSVCGAKFINWRQDVGGGGAIDLVMHLAEVDFAAAVAWLEDQLAGGFAAATAAADNTGYSGHLSTAEDPPRTLRLPEPDACMLDRVRRYLTGRRRLRAALLEPLLQCGRLYADRRGNAVFLLVAGKAQRPVGAELRGTGPRVWRGMAPGSRKDRGYFWIGATGSREIILCESAIDAISCFQMHPQRICISTSGVRANPPWLGGLIARGYTLHCGFDADQAGDEAAARMIALHPAIGRLRPPDHDWNDALAD